MLSSKTGGTSRIFDNDVPGYMAVFTDGLSASIHPELDTDINPSYLTGDFQVSQIKLIYLNKELKLKFYG